VLDRKYGKTMYPGTARLRIGGDQFFPFAIQTVMNAKKSVKLRTYIFDNDDFAVQIADGLKAISKQIEVKMMVDGLGTQMAQSAAPGMMPQDYSPPIGITTYLEKDSNIDLRVLTNPWFTGDHSKTTIVDSEIAFVGGMNIGREYRWEWHDLMMELTGPVVKAIEYEFDKAWAHAALVGDLVYPTFLASTELETGPAREGDYGVRILTTLPRESEVYRAQLNAIKRAEKYIWIQNAYFASTMVLYELVKARLRGVDVRVILPMGGNHGIMNKANVPAANTLLAYGARVFIYPGMSHVKAAVFDGWACLGSANWDRLSFRTNKELNLATSNPEAVDELLERIRAAILRYSAKYELDPLLVTAVIEVESGARPWARSPKGAVGLMQVMPFVASSMDLAGNLTTIEINIEAGCSILADNIRRLGEDDGISAYFWGSNIRGVAYLDRVRQARADVLRHSES